MQLSGQMVRMLDLRSTGHGFESWPPRCCRVQPWASCKHTCASVPRQYNLVPASGQWCLAAGKVTVGLASHWPRVTDISGSPPTGSRPRRGRWAPAYAHLVEYDELYLILRLTSIRIVKVAVWRSGSALLSIGKVTLQRARLVLGWVTIFIKSRDQPPRSTQPGHPFVDRSNEYRCNRRSGAALTMPYRHRGVGYGLNGLKERNELLCSK